MWTHSRFSGCAQGGTAPIPVTGPLVAMGKDWRELCVATVNRVLEPSLGPSEYFLVDQISAEGH